jgi:NhaP-type Na+/H+ or K+/H+ antiporter
MTVSFRRQLLLPLLIALTGFGLASVIDISNLPRQPFYEPFTYTLLAIGLYGSVYGIQPKELKNHNKLIIRAVTVGVLLKTFIIGGILFLAMRRPAAFLLALTVAQIDPLAVANLLTEDSSHLSGRARTILSAWSSFDDPMTVLLSIYALYFFIPHAASENFLGILLPFFIGLAQNLLFVGLAFWLSRQFKANNLLLILLLLACFVIAVYFKWMLGMALIGLFLRPNIKRLPDFISAGQRHQLAQRPSPGHGCHAGSSHRRFPADPGPAAGRTLLPGLCSAKRHYRHDPGAALRNRTS